eukprot:SM000068S20562  [mRNA]  locus=s68:158858:163752:- [translate_table: standard]
MERVRAGGRFDHGLFLRLCAALVSRRGGPSHAALAALAADHFLYADVRYYAYVNFRRLAERRLARSLTGRHDPLSSDEDDDGDDDDGGDGDEEERLGNGSADKGGQRRRRPLSMHAFARNMHEVLSRLPPPEEGGGGGSPVLVWAAPAAAAEQQALLADRRRKRARLTSSVDEDGKPGAAPQPKWAGSKSQRKAFNDAWLAFLRLPLPPDTYKQVLGRLASDVIPHMTSPVLLSDFLTDSYERGGATSVMALASLFLLITQHGLEYPGYYAKLYALLDHAVFLVRHRARFFEWADLRSFAWCCGRNQLVDASLKSTHLPAYLAAAFAKKLARLALHAPPQGALVVIALVHNLLRRHPAINTLVHRPEALPLPRQASEAASAEAQRPGVDPFRMTEADPARCDAQSSSLWEMETLRQHYCPSVARFMECLETDLTQRSRTAEVAVSDFAAESYASMITEHVKKRLKKVPLNFYSSAPSTLFPVPKSAARTDEGPFAGWDFGAVTSEDVRVDVRETVGDGATLKQMNGNDFSARPATGGRSNGLHIQKESTKRGKAADA